MKDRITMRGNIRIVDLFFIILLLGLLFGGIIFYFQSTTIGESTDERRLTVVEPYDPAVQSNNVLTAQQYGFSLLYPEGWRESDTMRSRGWEYMTDSYILTDMSVEEEAEIEDIFEAVPDHTVVVDLTEREGEETSTEFFERLFSYMHASTDAIEQPNNTEVTFTKIQFLDTPALQVKESKGSSTIDYLIFLHPTNNNWVVVSTEYSGESMPEQLRSSFSLINESIIVF